MNHSTANSIYEYYQLADERFFLAYRKGEKLSFCWEAKAQAITVKGYADFDLFLCREGKRVCLCEGLTGSIILRSKPLDMYCRRSSMRRNAMQLFASKLPWTLEKFGGVASINQHIVNFIFDNDQAISPRYKTIKL